MAELEKTGLPTVSIAARGFEADFQTSARVFGVPQLPFIVIPYTLTSRSREETEGDLDAVFDGIATALVTDPPKPPPARKANVLPADLEQFAGIDRLEGWEKFNRDFMDRGLGDGFPLVAPTPQLVEAFLKNVTQDPLEVVGYLAPGEGAATVEKVAINAAMAGCEPEHLPVLIAAVEAVTQTPQNIFPTRTIAMSTGPHAMMMLVNGPVVQQLGINSGRCTLGPGKPGRVNTALGRALRLILMNVGHCYAGSGDMDTIGSPLKYSMCLAENEGESPWEPFHVERGFQKEQSTVTVFGTLDILHNANYQRDTSQLLLAWAARASAAGAYPPVIPSRVERDENHLTMLMCPDHARNLAQDGHSKASIREYIAENSKSPIKYVLATGRTSLDSLPNDHRWILNLDPETLVSTYPQPHLVHLLVVGGPTGKSDMVRNIGAPTDTREICNIA
ncbi:MAG: hypothetical protein QGH97_00785 [Dehalococcoidia bacterium]|jgi:hypothetical protein|nr:hypothetical protein [Dehalococcoidia bacterium]MDP7082897.1 hypothetical protein [Dehalococcoidia bacterium]HJN86675.1 hypothetical protein [Dehalococcoidia bacterium]